MLWVQDLQGGWEVAQLIADCAVKALQGSASSTR